MRLYLKLILMIVIFGVAARFPLLDAASDVAFDIRVEMITRFGSAADFETLVDQIGRKLAQQGGREDVYLKGRDTSNCWQTALLPSPHD